MANRQPPFDDETIREIDQARSRMDAYISKGRFYPTLEEEPESDIEIRLRKVEAQLSKPGSIPKWYHDQTKQLEGQVLHLQAKVEELLKIKKGKDEI